MNTAAEHRRNFASDNWAGAHPEVIDAIVAANIGHTPSYGGDPWTTQFAQIMRTEFGPDTAVFPVLNGTGANVLALQAALPRWGAVICAASAHINADETGAPEKTGGLKLLPVPTPDGKLTPELVDLEAWGWGNQHRAQPLAISVSQVTEWGTCYTPDELRQLAAHAHERGMLLHLDGSRLSNAAAHLGVSLGEAAAGADIVSLGGTKNGLLGAEAVIVRQPDMAPGIEYLRKTVLQLGSKMRFLSAQLTALYAGDLWLRSAQHANDMAGALTAGLKSIAEAGDQGAAARGIRIVQPVQSNVVFATLPPHIAEHARAEFAFADWQGDHTVRLMCAFDTTSDDVDALLLRIRNAAALEHRNG